MNPSVSPLLVILNPAANSGRGSDVRSRVEAGLKARGIPFDLVETRGPGDAKDLAADATKRGIERILAVGGDGTVHEVANGILQAAGPGTGPSLGVVPVGTGNDFFRMVGIPREIDGVLDLLLQGRDRFFDAGHARWNGGAHWFVNYLGVGIDVEVLRRRERFRRLRGLPQYLAAALTALVSFKPVSLSVRATGPEPEMEFQGLVLISAVTVGPSVGGGFILSPSARADDGELDLFMVEPVGPIKVARYLPRILRGTHGSEPEITLKRVHDVHMAGPNGADFSFQMDGEIVEGSTPTLDVSIVPGALRVLVPDSESASPTGSRGKGTP